MPSRYIFSLIFQDLLPCNASTVVVDVNSVGPLHVVKQIRRAAFAYAMMICNKAPRQKLKRLARIVRFGFPWWWRWWNTCLFPFAIISLVMSNSLSPVRGLETWRVIKFIKLVLSAPIPNPSCSGGWVKKRILIRIDTLRCLIARLLFPCVDYFACDDFEFVSGLRLKSRTIVEFIASICRSPMPCARLTIF